MSYLELAKQLCAELGVSSRLPKPPGDPGWLGLRIASRVLGLDVWLVDTDADAGTLEAQLVAEGERVPLIFTVAEVLPLAGMIEADRRALLGALVTIKRAMPGATLAEVAAASEVTQ